MITILKERYETGAVLGENAYAVTRIAYDRLLRQRVAVKEFYPKELVYREEGTGILRVIPGKDAGVFEQEKETFFEEIRSVFGHYELQGMTAVKDYFRENNTVYVVTEHLTGGSLKEYLEKQPKKRITIEEAVNLLLPVMEALTFLHSKGIVHGGVNADRLYFDENGVCRLTGLGTCFLRNASGGKSASPEQRNHAEQVGPWSDVYGVCATLYRMLAGRKVTDVQRRFHKDRVRPLSAYAKVDDALEKAVMQGLEPDVQKRYFYMGAFAEGLSADSGQMRPFLGEIQAQWGELWLKLCLEEEAEGKKRHFIFTRRQKKVFLTGAACLAGACLASASGLYLYGETHPNERLQFHLKQDLHYAEGKYIDDNTGNKFPIREDTLREALALKLEQSLTDCISVTKDAASYEWKQYALRGNKEFFVRIESNMTDRSVTGLEVQGDREICKEIMIEILPVLVPEAYLTEDEAEELCLKADADKSAVVRHGLYNLYLQRFELGDDSAEWKVEIYANRYYEKDGEGVKAAGNYPRGSEEYKRFEDFLKEYGTASEGADGEITYTLTKEEVMRWGQPSNQYVLSAAREDFLEKLEKCGYKVILEKTKEEYLVIDKKYGIFESEFNRKEDFRLGEDLGMRLISDTVSEKISTVGIYSETENLQETAACAADVVLMVSEDIAQSKGELQAILQGRLEDYRREIEANPGKNIYSAEAWEDCFCTFLDVDGRYYIIISRTDDMAVPYFWPVLADEN